MPSMSHGDGTFGQRDDALVEPRSKPTKPPLPRDPTTTSPALFDASTSAVAGGRPVLAACCAAESMATMLASDPSTPTRTPDSSRLPATPSGDSAEVHGWSITSSSGRRGVSGGSSPGPGQPTRNTICGLPNPPNTRCSKAAVPGTSIGWV
jgi:hypothetical protein